MQFIRNLGISLCSVFMVEFKKIIEKDLFPALLECN